MKKFKNLFFVFGFLFLVIALVSCQSKKFKVEFDLNYENATGAPKTQEVVEGEKATEPLAPERAGYDFLGWYEDKAGEKKYSFNTEVKSNLILYAKWVEADPEVVYYLAGSFNGYEPKDDNYIMKKGKDGLFTITVELTKDNRDNSYDGHYYKVTDGTWDNCYGVDNYYITPAPLSPTGGGLGSIWHWANGTLTVTFDAEKKEITDTLVIKTDIIEDFDPVIYGEFNGWKLEGENAFVLTDSDNDGVYTGTIEFSEAGTSDFTVCLSRKWYDDQWGQRWGANDQYKLDGTTAGMGNTSSITYEIGIYLFSYNSTTKVTTYVKLEGGYVDTYALPRIYGEFNGWKLDDDKAFVLTDLDNDGVYTGTIEFSEAGKSDFTVCLSRKWYDDEWGKRWGANEQYKLDGTAAGMGGTTSIDYEAGTYLFSYNSITKVTTYGKLEGGYVDTYDMPRIYGEFNGWKLDDDKAFVLTDLDNDGVYTGTIEFSEAGTSDFTVCLSRKWYDDQWGQRWGANDQYKLDGTTAGMGNTSSITYEIGIYLFSYNSTTKVTTYVKLEGGYVDTYALPRIYGEFNGWKLDDDKAFVLTDLDNDGVYTGTIEFSEAGKSDFTVCLSRKWYDDEWGKRWGANEQYKLDGTAAGMGGTTSIDYEAGTYSFSYNSATKITTYTKIS